MNLSRIIVKQIELDKALNDAHNIHELVHKHEKVILALYVEVAELANEIQSFKYWKKNKNINDELISEEYADGLHFLMSFSNDYQIKNIIEPLILNEDINLQFINMFEQINKLVKNCSCEEIEKAIAIYLGIAKLINLSENEIEEAYFKKNRINFERIKNNY